MNAALAMSSVEEIGGRAALIDDYVEVHSEPAAAPPPASARDKRGVHRMAPELHETHHHLVSWAKLYAGDQAGVGWQRKSLLGRLIEQGPNGLSQGSAPVLSISEDDLATDAAVAHLGEIDRRAVIAYYVDWHKVRDGAWWKLIGMKEKQAGHVLNRARWRVNGYRAGWYRGKV